MALNGKLKGKLAALNASEFKKFASEKKIVSYPTIHLYKKGIFANSYVGKFTASDLFDFFKKSQKKIKEEL